MIELEKRALLNETDYKRIITFLNKNAEFEKEKHRFSIIYLTNQDYSVNTESLTDVRIRIDDKNKGLLTIKHGNWQKMAGRDEYELKFDPKQLEQLLNILKLLGHAWGTTTAIVRKEWKYLDFKITLDSFIGLDIYVIEVEFLAKENNDLKSVENRIVNLMAEKLVVKVISEKQLFDFLAMINTRKGWQFDFTKQSISDWLKQKQQYLS